MKISFDYGEAGFTLVVQANPILNNMRESKFTGIRRLNNIYLSDDNFRTFHSALCFDDFEVIRSIMDKLLDVSEEPPKPLLHYVPNFSYYTNPTPQLRSHHLPSGIPVSQAFHQERSLLPSRLYHHPALPQ
jgi:hypothetical protein